MWRIEAATTASCAHALIKCGAHIDAMFEWHTSIMSIMSENNRMHAILLWPHVSLIQCCDCVRLDARPHPFRKDLIASN